LSQVVLTHHNLKHQGKQKMNLGEGEQPKLAPLTEAGSGEVLQVPGTVGSLILSFRKEPRDG
jgi:hypothetical protein